MGRGSNKIPFKFAKSLSNPANTRLARKPLCIHYIYIHYMIRVGVFPSDISNNYVDIIIFVDEENVFYLVGSELS